MCFPALHFLKGAEPWIFVVEAEHKTERDFVVFQVVQKAAAKRVVLHGPARGVHHQARLGFGWIDFPQLFDADGIALWVAAFGQVVFGDDLFAQVATCALGEDRVLGVQFHAELEVVGRLTVFADAEVAGGHAFDGTLLVIQNFCSREARENFNADGFRMRRHPFRHVAE